MGGLLGVGAQRICWSHLQNYWRGGGGLAPSLPPLPTPMHCSILVHILVLVDCQSYKFVRQNRLEVKRTYNVPPALLFLRIPSTAELNGSNTLGTNKICSRQGLFKLMSVNQSTRSGGIIWISSRFS